MERSRSPHESEHFKDAIRHLEEQRGRLLTDEEMAEMEELANQLAQTGREVGEAVLARRREKEANN